VSAASRNVAWVRSVLIASGVILGAGAALSSSARADALIFDRGLPTANLNNAAGANRSNVAWADGGDAAVAMGDNFSLVGANYLANDIRVWVIDSQTPSNTFSLLLGTDLGAGTVVSQVATSTSVTATTYANGATYQGSSGNYINLYQVDFSNLNLTLRAGTYAFGVSGPTDPAVSGLNTPFLSASNGLLSGSTQTGSDGYVYGYTSTGAMDTADGYPWASIGGWDKSSDINVQVFGTNVPEPASMLLIGTGVAALGVVRRRRGAGVA
jgi:PEP-CTERM motif